MKKDIEIAREASMKPIAEMAQMLGIPVKDIEMYGNYKAKLPLHLIDEKRIKNAKLILVSAISPTPAGEGKTTVSIGLSQGLNRIGKRATVVLREPSLGPVFGMKGGAAGGGYSQVLPMEDINLHFTGDFAAIEKAHNLLSALIDNNLQSKNGNLGLDARTVVWKRVMDMNDRSLRRTVIGLGGTGSGIPRETGFDITAASEVMAILCLSKDINDLKERLANIFIGYTFDKKPIYARDLKAQGAMAALLKDAIKPNLVQTIEGTPAIIHGGPFANIAQGTNSIIATKMGLSHSDYVVTEAGFGFDLGGEKFLDIKCRAAGLSPHAVVLVATVRALKYHGGALLKELTTENVDTLKKGVANLEKHIENVRHFGLQPIVAINRFVSDTDAELEALRKFCTSKGVACKVAEVFTKGGEGAENLAQEVVKLAEQSSGTYSPLYNLELSIEEKIEKIAREVYGAGLVELSSKAHSDVKKIEALGLSRLPVCIAKTQKSLSDDPDLIGRPRDFMLHVREIEIAAGAGFVVPITGEIMRMPGLPDTPSAENIDIDEHGNISGLS